MKIETGNDEYQPPKSGLLLLQCCIVLLFALFCARFWYLQIHRGADYVRMAQENRLRDERIFAPRGEIYDASGELVAENRTAYGILSGHFGGACAGERLDRRAARSSSRAL